MAERTVSRGANPATVTEIPANGAGNSRLFRVCRVVSCHKPGKMSLSRAVAHHRVTTKPGEGGMMRRLDRLDAWKTNFGQGATWQLEKLLTAAAKWRLATPAEGIRSHETLLFPRAYPRSPRVARLADQILFHFADRIARLPSAGVDTEPFAAPEVSGIAGTSVSAVFSREVASGLAPRHPRRIDIGWDRCDEIEKFGPVLARILPLLAEDWPVEAHVPFRQWIAAARPPRTTDLAWLLQQLAALPLSPGERSKIYGSLDLPLTWEIGNSPVSRSRLRLPGSKPFVHREPLIRRGDVSLVRELESPPMALRRLPPPEARRMLDLIVDASAMRYRELYGFSHPDERAVDHADLGRGVERFFFGRPPVAPAVASLPRRHVLQERRSCRLRGAALSVRTCRSGLQPVLYVPRRRIRLDLRAPASPLPPGARRQLLLRRPVSDRPGESRADRFRRLLVLPQAGLSPH